MRTIYAPSYAIIFMAKFESIHIYQYIGDKAILYLRYIGDLFFIQKGTKEELISFIEGLNKNTPSLNSILSTQKHRDKSFQTLKSTKTLLVNFFQPFIVNQQNYLQNYLHFKSAHPKYLKKRIPYSQALRILKTCSKTNEVTKHLAELKEAFLKGSYQET